MYCQSIMLYLLYTLTCIESQTNRSTSVHPFLCILIDLWFSFLQNHLYNSSTRTTGKPGNQSPIFNPVGKENWRWLGLWNHCKYTQHPCLGSLNSQSSLIITHGHHINISPSCIHLFFFLTISRWAMTKMFTSEYVWAATVERRPQFLFHFTGHYKCPITGSTSVWTWQMLPIECSGPTMWRQWK